MHIPIYQILADLKTIINCEGSFPSSNSSTLSFERDTLKINKPVPDTYFVDWEEVRVFENSPIHTTGKSKKPPFCRAGEWQDKVHEIADGIRRLHPE